jgi:hypothetical protein
MRRFAGSDGTRAGVSSFPKLSAGSPQLLAWVYQMGIEPGSAPTVAAERATTLAIA